MTKYDYTNNQNDYKISIKAPSQQEAETSLKEIIGAEVLKKMNWKIIE